MQMKKFGNITELKKLNKAYTDFKEKRISYNLLKEKTTIFAYNFITNYLKDKSEDFAHDLFLKVYESIHKLIQRYNPEIKKYGYYILMNIYYQKKNHERAYYEKKVLERIIQNRELYKIRKDIKPDYVNEKKIIYRNRKSYNEAENRKKIKKFSTKKLMVLLLRQSCHMSAIEIDSFCKVFDINKNQALHNIYVANEITKSRKERFRKLCEIRDNHFCKITLLRNQFINENDSVEQKKIKARLDNHEMGLIKINDTIQRCRLEPSSSEISKILGMPKGTVDSTINTVSRNEIIISN